MSEEAHVTVITEIRATDANVPRDAFPIKVNAYLLPKGDGVGYTLNDAICKVGFGENEPYSVNKLSRESMWRYGLCGVCVRLSLPSYRTKLEELLDTKVESYLVSGCDSIEQAQFMLGEAVECAIREFTARCKEDAGENDVLDILKMTLSTNLDDIKEEDTELKVTDAWCAATDENGLDHMTIYRPITVNGFRYFVEPVH